MDMIDPITLKLLKRFRAIQKNAIMRHKDEMDEKYEQTETCVTLNQIKEWFKYYPWNNVRLTLWQLEKSEMIVQIRSPRVEYTVMDPDSKVFTISGKGWSVLKTYYFKIWLSVVIPILSFGISLAALIIAIFVN